MIIRKLVFSIDKPLQKQKKKHERDQTEAMGNEAEMSKYLNKVLKNKARKDIGTLKKAMGTIRPREQTH